MHHHRCLVSFSALLALCALLPACQGESGATNPAGAAGSNADGASGGGASGSAGEPSGGAAGAATAGSAGEAGANTTAGGAGGTAGGSGGSSGGAAGDAGSAAAAGGGAAGQPDGGDADSGDAAFVDASQSCSDYAVPPVTTANAIVIVNQRSTNVYLGRPVPDCSYDIGFALEDADGDPQVLVQDECSQTCILQQQLACECPAFCPPGIVTLVAPGKSYDIGWPGTVFVPAPMPSKCYVEPSCATSTCPLEQAAEPGSTLIVTAYTQALCNGTPCNDCTPGSGGNCIVQGATGTGGTPITATAVWNGEGQHQLVVQ